MLHRLVLAGLIALVAIGPVHAQDGADARFDAPDLPTPNAYRAASGRPGPDYWQQRADYAIRATLDPATRTITGSETITYTNRSPDSLAYVWVQLDQNLFAPGSGGAQVYPQGGRFGGGGFVGGFDIRRVASGGRDLGRRVRDRVLVADQLNQVLGHRFLLFRAAPFAASP